ncbi:MAG: gamma-glutamyl-gamma-aminobutyrate hydrolase family protein [Oscillospiraceae bacterium]|nr:gamma-glutamyl-gamma-aminobutyrate hydrolase family protein [Oscillospiraceae bacterium]
MKVFLPLGDFPNYVRALDFCGAVIERERPEGCGALLLPGGGDVDPALYGQENTASKGIDTERDRRESEAFRLFLQRGLPIFGVCRGAQLINVLLGGTLHQDIPGHRQDGNDELRHGSRTVDPLLLSLYGERFVVNSTHHQAADRLGEGLRAVQWADDGTVEAIRHETLPIFAVQWHPERHHEPIEGWRLFEAVFRF